MPCGVGVATSKGVRARVEHPAIVVAVEALPAVRGPDRGAETVGAAAAAVQAQAPGVVVRPDADVVVIYRWLHLDFKAGEGGAEGGGVSRPRR